MKPLLLVLAGLPCAGCYLSHSLPDEGAEPAGPITDCSDERPICMIREAGPCSRLVTVEAVCGDDDSWRCPAGSIVRVAVPSEETCLPFRNSLQSVRGILLPVDGGDGTCRWMFDEGRSLGGDALDRVGVGLDPALSIGACPDVIDAIEAAPLVDTGALASDRLIQPLDIVSVGEDIWFSYQLFVLDTSEVFGVRGLGKGLVSLDPGSGSFRPVEDLAWQEDPAGTTTYGDSVVLVGDEAFVYGCRGPVDFLATECRLARVPVARIGDPAAYTYWARSDWDGVEGAHVVTRSGVDTNVRYHPELGVFVLATVPGLGDALELRTAPAPEGPWSDVLVRIPCELPADDPESFCTAAVQHPELMDPLAPSTLVITYAVSSLGPRFDSPDAYWPRLVRVAL